MSIAPSGWDGLLDEGEVFLWQGRPEAGLPLHNTDVTSTGMGVFS